MSPMNLSLCLQPLAQHPRGPELGAEGPREDIAGGAVAVGAPWFGAAGQNAALFVLGFLLASPQTCTFLLPLRTPADGLPGEGV